MGFFEDLLSGEQGLEPSQGLFQGATNPLPLGGFVLPPAEKPPPPRIPPAEGPPGQDLNPDPELEDIGLLPIFREVDPSFGDVFRHLSPYLDDFSQFDLGSHFANLSIGEGIDLQGLARLLMPSFSGLANALVSSNPFVQFQHGLTTRELRELRAQQRLERLGRG